ncbi:IucA/IucC family siderophore biosynthesis protein [Saccharomonospora sp. CUA-673]|uniref:IucA/IucC family protein n=1 Tax=Saccharomonospora sp. CUA-673 TaxID=1904969 RepID=UPI00210073FD|nr:IucA/IucC family protein [Saccharomonospora sp. CUA-673]
MTDGHRYHPTYKSRLGFGVDDNLAYGPEFRPNVRPLWLSVDRSIAEVAGPADEGAFLRAQYPEAAGPSRTLVPVHPWQWDRHLAAAFATEIASGAIRLLGPDPDRFRPQQSIRTMSCVDRPKRPYLKLSMSIVNTSTSRVLAPHTVHNAPAISAWLAGIAADDPFLRDELRTVFLRELMGTAVTAGDDPIRRGSTYGTLACIWRESLHPYLDAGESGVPFTGLTARDIDGTPLIDPWVREQGLTPWVRRIAETVVVPVLHLLCRHGIALESHAQNMVLLHRDGVPTRVALRDFHDGVRFSRDRLAEPQRAPTLRSTPSYHENRNSFVETDDPALVADFVLDALLFVGVGELAIFLADATDSTNASSGRLRRTSCAGICTVVPNPDTTCSPRRWPWRN